MEKWRILSRVVVLSIGFILCGALSGAMAADGITVTDIQPIYVEKGAENYLISLKANVTNANAPENIAIEVVAVDVQGFQLQTVKMTGRVEPGKTKVLMERVKMAKETFDQITRWELKK